MTATTSSKKTRSNSQHASSAAAVEPTSLSASDNKSPADSSDFVFTTAPIVTRSHNGIFKKRQLKDAAATSSDEELPLAISPKKTKISSANISLSAEAQSSESHAESIDNGNMETDDVTDFDISMSPLKLASCPSLPSPSLNTVPNIDQPLMAAINLNTAKPIAVSAASTPANFAAPRDMLMDLNPEELSAIMSIYAERTRHSTSSNAAASSSLISTPAPTSSSVDRVSPAFMSPIVESVDNELEPHEAARILRVDAHRKRDSRLNTSSNPYPSPLVPDYPTASVSPLSSPTPVKNPIKSQSALSASDMLHPDEELDIKKAIELSKQDTLTKNNALKSSKSASLSKKRLTFQDKFPKSPSTPMMSNGPALLEDSMKYRVPALPATCEVTKPHLQDDFLKDDYITMPPLLSGCLILWNETDSDVSAVVNLVSFSRWSDQCGDLDFEAACNAVRFVRHKQFINPSRVSPLDVNIHYTGHDQKRAVLQCNFKTAICLSALMSIECYLLLPSPASLRNKHISGYMHKQEWERFEAFSCMVFNCSKMIAQINSEALSFGTLGMRKDHELEPSTPSKSLRNSIFSSSLPSKSRKMTDRVFKSLLHYMDTVPVYDARSYPEFNYASDLDNIDVVLPLFEEEVPAGFFVVVAYTLGNFDNVSGNANLATNIQFVILIATPSVSVEI